MGGMSRAINDVAKTIEAHQKSKMKIPTTTSYINIGSGSSQSSYEETTTSNKSSTYNRNSKRGTRLVRSS